VLGPAVGIAQLDRQRQRQVRDVRERVPRIHRQRREDREHLRLEELVDRHPLRRRQLGHPGDRDAVLGERRQQDLLQAAIAARQQRAHARVDRVELLDGGQSVGLILLRSLRDLAPQPRHPDHVELVQVRTEDREELHPLQQRRPLVERLVQDAGVEGEPAQLAVDEERGGRQPRAHVGSAGEHATPARRARASR
jgi:hypothetical protein